ncbi:DNA polymerase III subunit beta [Paenibacillus sp. CCS19]|uniref:DNA polymerase III subunit beta n=1 Tax=Paenibacillus sp. CCS19 TaxID=3158387 RepID=UPI002565D2FD|nr:DNA polymerase III subunit beta [Paenibacillus cellulosilyticus]GMK39684.1 DNA polymerase III subunit beta [Paenibacillus cellulosilyticus]
MLIHITKERLMHALQHVLKAVSANNPIPILTGIHMEATATGLILTGSHSSMSIDARIEQDGAALTVLATGSIVVSARYFYEIVRKLDDGLVIVDGIESAVIAAISTENTSIRLCGMDAALYPKVNRIDDDSTINRFRMTSGLLKSAIKQVAVAVSTSESRPVLTGVCMSYRGGSELQFTTTDGIRLATCSIPIDNHEDNLEPSDFIVPGRCMLDMASMLADHETYIELEASAQQIVFRTTALHIQMASIEGAFPSANAIIPRTYRSEITIETAQLLLALERATVLAGDRIVRLTANRERLCIVSRSAAIGDMKASVPIAAMKGDEFELSLNGKMLVDIVRCFDCRRLRLWYTGDRSPIVLQPAGKEGTSPVLYLLTPVRTPVQAG